VKQDRIQLVQGGALFSTKGDVAQCEEAIVPAPSPWEEGFMICGLLSCQTHIFTIFSGSLSMVYKIYSLM